MDSKQLSSGDLSEIMVRLKEDKLSNEDKTTISEILSHTIDMKKLLESATESSDGKTVVASLPFGFDIVK